MESTCIRKKYDSVKPQITIHWAYRSFSLSRVKVGFAFSNAPMTDMTRSLISFARSLNLNACMTPNHDMEPGFDKKWEIMSIHLLYSIKAAIICHFWIRALDLLCPCQEWSAQVEMNEVIHAWIIWGMVLALTIWLFSALLDPTCSIQSCDRPRHHDDHP